MDISQLKIGLKVGDTPVLYGGNRARLIRVPAVDDVIQLLIYRMPLDRIDTPGVRIKP